MPYLPFARSLALWRIERGLSQEELARRAGIPRPNLSAIERGKRDLTLATLRALAGALHVRPGVLVDGIPPRAEEGKAPLSREEMERVADRVVWGGSARNRRERALVEALRSLVWHRLTPIQRGGGDPRRGYRSAARAWLWLRSTYPPEAVKSLLQRITDREARAA